MEGIETAELTFIRHGQKLYAKTPLGEIAFGDHGGLYEWVSGHRVQYTSGDRQAAAGGQMLRSMSNPDVWVRGWRAALVPYNYVTN